MLFVVLLFYVVQAFAYANGLSLRQLIRKTSIHASESGAIVPSTIARYETIFSSNIPVNNITCIVYFLFLCGLCIVCYLHNN